MLINFNTEKLDKLLYDFYTITGLTVGIWNADLHQLSYQPREMRAFCDVYIESFEELLYPSDKRELKRR